MIKHIMATIVLSFICIPTVCTTDIFASDAVASCYGKGDRLGSAGLSLYHFGLFAAFDYGFHDCISGGAGLGYNGQNHTLGEIRNNYFPVVVRGAFHPFNLSALSDKIVIRNMLDVYIGLTAGWAFGFQTHNPNFVGYTDKSIHHLILREYLGFRYHFHEKWSLFIEDCADLSFFSIGVTRRF